MLRLKNLIQSPIFKEFSAGSDRKESFFGFIIPMANKINASVMQDRQKLLNIDIKANSDDSITDF